MQRNIVIRVRLTKAEYDFILSEASRNKNTKCKNGTRNLSAYIRHCILSESGYLEKEKQQRELKNIAYQIRKVGININQATKKINSGYYGTDTCMELQKGLKEIKGQFAALLKKLEE